MIGSAILLFACWIPSLFWNVMRFREAVLYHERLDPSIFARGLASHIPPDIKLTGSPELFLIAKKAGLDFTPLSGYPSRTEVPAGTWVLLTEGDHREGERVAPGNLSARPVVLSSSRGPLSPGRNTSSILMSCSVPCVITSARVRVPRPIEATARK